MSRGRLGAYALWQIRDFALQRGIAIAIIGALFLLQVRLAVSGFGAAGANVRMLATELLGPFLLIASIVAINGIISSDRRQGHFRFLFAKPVSMVRYYLQAFAVHGAGVVAATALFLLAFWWISGTAMPARTVLYSVPAFMLLGGLGFLFSAALRSDWILLAGTVVMTQILRGLYEDESGVVAALVNWLLPPLHVFGDMRRTLGVGGTPETSAIVWPIAYGAVAIVAGVVVLRRRSMAV